MRFTVSSTALSSKLTALSRVINSKSSLPILGDFVFDASTVENDSIRVTERERKHISVLDEQEEKLVNVKTSVEKKERRKKFSEKEQVESTVFTDSLTFQSDNSYAERGHSHTDQMQKEGNNAQRSHRGTCRAIFRVAWFGGCYEKIRRDEGRLLWHSRLARHRKRSDGLLYGEEKTGSAGRWRAAKTNGSGMDSGIGKRCKWWAGSITDRKQFTSTVLFNNIIDRRA